MSKLKLRLCLLVYFIVLLVAHEIYSSLRLCINALASLVSVLATLAFISFLQSRKPSAKNILNRQMLMHFYFKLVYYPYYFMIGYLGYSSKAAANRLDGVDQPTWEKKLMTSVMSFASARIFVILNVAMYTVISVSRTLLFISPTTFHSINNGLVLAVTTLFLVAVCIFEIVLSQLVFSPANCQFNEHGIRLHALPLDVVNQTVLDQNSSKTCTLFPSFRIYLVLLIFLECLRLTVAMFKKVKDLIKKRSATCATPSAESNTGQEETAPTDDLHNESHKAGELQEMVVIEPATTLSSPQAFQNLRPHLKTGDTQTQFTEVSDDALVVVTTAVAPHEISVSMASTRENADKPDRVVMSGENEPTSGVCQAGVVPNNSSPNSPGTVSPSEACSEDLVRQKEDVQKLAIMLVDPIDYIQQRTCGPSLQTTVTQPSQTINQAAFFSGSLSTERRGSSALKNVAFDGFASVRPRRAESWPLVNPLPVYSNTRQSAISAPSLISLPTPSSGQILWNMALERPSSSSGPISPPYDRRGSHTYPDKIETATPALPSTIARSSSSSPSPLALIIRATQEYISFLIMRTYTLIIVIAFLYLLSFFVPDYINVPRHLMIVTDITYIDLYFVPVFWLLMDKEAWWYTERILRETFFSIKLKFSSD